MTKTSHNTKEQVVSNEELKMFKFTECMINKVSYQKFMLKNLSGIKTKFNFSSTKFMPYSIP